MRKGLVVLGCFVGSSVFAANTYDITMKLSMKGQPSSYPHMHISEGKTASIVENTAVGKTFIEVVAKEGAIQNHKGILMDFVIGRLEQDGTKTILFTPRVLTAENEPAQVSIGEKNGQQMSLSVIAERQSL